MSVFKITHESVTVKRPRVLELYCGLGGLAAAVGEAAEVAMAVDINPLALGVYRHNFEHLAVAKLVDSLGARTLEALDCDLWWASPPCQPFTRRGLKRDLEDPRAETFKSLMAMLKRVRPPYFALENVVGFEDSEAQQLMLEILARSGYCEVVERCLCPSEFGVPNQRPRYYVVAGRFPLGDLAAPSRSCRRRLHHFLELPDSVNDELLVASATAERYRGAMHCVAPGDDTAITHCFTSAYGRSPVRSGSYLETRGGPRYFTPLEILRLLGFPAGFNLPAGFRRSNAWRLCGNSLSLLPVRHMLSSVPGLEGLRPSASR